YLVLTYDTLRIHPPLLLLLAGKCFYIICCNIIAFYCFHAYIIQLFKYLPVLIAYGYIYGMKLLCRTFKRSFYRVAIVKVPAYRELHMVVGHPYIVCWVYACPSAAGYPCLHPGMGGALAPHTIFIGANIPAYIAAWYAGMAEQFQ